MDLKMTQIVACPWDGDTGRTYSIIALDKQGRVWRYDAKCAGWIAWHMKPVDTSCRGPRR